MNKLIAFLLIPLFTSTLIQGCASSGGSSDGQSRLSKDAQIIQELESRGKDLNRVRNIEFFLYFPSESAAEDAVEVLAGEGFKIELSKDDFKKMWLVLATQEVLPNESTMLEYRRKFESLTRESGGQYLDWGAPMAE